MGVKSHRDRLDWAAIEADRRAGMSGRQLAKKYRVDDRYILSVLRERMPDFAEVYARLRSESLKAARRNVIPRPRKPGMDERVDELLKQGWRSRAIAKELGVGLSRVQARRRMLGFEVLSPETIARREWVTENAKDWYLMDAARHLGVNTRQLAYDERACGVEFKRVGHHKNRPPTRNQTPMDGFDPLRNSMLARSWGV